MYPFISINDNLGAYTLSLYTTDSSLYGKYSVPLAISLTDYPTVTTTISIDVDISILCLD